MTKLFKETKENGRFIKVVVLPCSSDEEKIPDCREQYYAKEEIAIMMSTEANNCLFDFNHNNKELGGIYTIENYQSKGDEYVNDIKIPAGSWMKLVFSENEKINNQIKNGVITGVSNDFTIDTDKSYCKFNNKLEPGINTFVYDDVPEKECIVQNWLSFVDYPCNNMPIESWSYKEFKILNGDYMELKDKVKKLFNKEEEPKEFVIENKEDVIRIINEVTTEKIQEYEATLEQVSMLLAEDMDFIKQDLEAAKQIVDELKAAATGEEPADPTEEPAIENDGDEPVIENDETDPNDGAVIENETLAEVVETLKEIQNRIDAVEKKDEENKKIRNNALIKNLNKKKEVRGFLNRNADK